MGQPARGRSAKYGAVSTWARQVTARELTARDGRGLTTRGHMARELTPSDGSWAHSSSICGYVRMCERYWTSFLVRYEQEYVTTVTRHKYSSCEPTSRH